MATKKDMRRVDLVIPYVAPPASKSDTDIAGMLEKSRISLLPGLTIGGAALAGTMSTTLPMAAMFTRNRMIGWVSVVISLQNWLSDSPEQSKNSATPGYMSIFMSLMALAVTYMPLFFPPPGVSGGSATAAAPAPSPSP